MLLVSDGINVLTAANSYTGKTLVNSGTLRLTGNGSIFASALITVNSGAMLDVSGRGDATLTLANGQIMTGNGTVKGNVVVGSGATLAPGGALTTMTFNNNLTLNGGSVTKMEISKSPTTDDAAQVAGALTYGGTLVVTNISAGSFAVGDSFKLFNAANYSGAFANIVPATPAANLAWNTNTLSGGVLSIVVSPTPPPAICHMAVVGNKFILSGTNGLPKGIYYVLTSSNLALPYNQWTPIATNPFDAAGCFSFTNPPGTNTLQLFYMIELPQN